MITFRNVFERLAPTWLTTGDGAKVLYSLGLILDASLERVRQSLVARFPEYTESEESLALIGRDRLIVRGRAESADAYAKRLIQWRYPLGHRVRGNAWGMLRQVRAYFGNTVDQFTIDRRGTWCRVNADGSESYALNTGLWAGGNDLPVSPNWARFWLGVNAPAGWTYPQTLLVEGPTALWGGVLEETSEYVLGIDGATQSDIQALRQIAGDWKPAGTRKEYLLIVLDPAFSVNLNSYMQYASTGWFELGGDLVAYSNAQTVPIPL